VKIVYYAHYPTTVKKAKKETQEEGQITCPVVWVQYKKEPTRAVLFSLQAWGVLARVYYYSQKAELCLAKSGKG
tara:strand:+ start:434 stop:655 length:222 start_codon:yes stop_codon:yes gene_type:complete